jgi:hypothetical protein
VSASTLVSAASVLLNLRVGRRRHRRPIGQVPIVLPNESISAPLALDGVRVDGSVFSEKLPFCMRFVAASARPSRAYTRPNDASAVANINLFIETPGFFDAAVPFTQR